MSRAQAAKQEAEEAAKIDSSSIGSAESGGGSDQPLRGTSRIGQGSYEKTVSEKSAGTEDRSAQEEATVDGVLRVVIQPTGGLDSMLTANLAMTIPPQVTEGQRGSAKRAPPQTKISLSDWLDKLAGQKRASAGDAHEPPRRIHPGGITEELEQAVCHGGA